MGCRIILSLRIAAQSPYRILVGRKVFAEHLANPAALFRAIERCWTKAIGTPDPRDLQMARILAEKGLSCDLVVGNRLNGRHHRGRQEIICVECTTVPDSRFSFRLELGWRCCFLRLWSSRRYKVRDREVLTRLMDRMTAGEFDLRRTPTELPSGIMDAFAVEDVTL